MSNASTKTPAPPPYIRKPNIPHLTLPLSSDKRVAIFSGTG